MALQRGTPLYNTKIPSGIPARLLETARHSAARSLPVSDARSDHEVFLVLYSKNHLTSHGFIILKCHNNNNRCRRGGEKRPPVSVYPFRRHTSLDPSATTHGEMVEKKGNSNGPSKLRKSTW